jgi:integrase
VDLEDWASAPDLVRTLRRLQEDFSMVRLVLADEEEQRQGEAVLESQAQELMEEVRSLIKRNTSQTLHAALDAFGAYLRQRYTDHDDRLSLTGQVATKEIPLLKRHIEDMPLCNLDNDAVERWIGYWAKRPMTKRRKPAAVKTCTNIIKRIRMFVRWLHRAKEWDWRKPEDYEVLPVKIKANQSELARRAAGDQVATYTDAELALLWKHAKPKERLLLLLGLNCGFGIAEVASLQRGEIHLDKPHREYGTEGNWIMRIRHKNGVYGEWKLWDETAAAIRWYLSVRPQSERAELILTEKGEPVADQTSGGNRAQTIPNTWGRLTQRVRKLEDKAFRKLSFNKLRKTSSTAIRKLCGGEVAGIFLAHGNPVPTDSLVDLYANRDFTQVHEACDRWRERLSPMFVDVAAPFVKEKRKHQKPEAILEKRARIVALRAENKTLKQIGQEVGLSINAVRHHLLQAGVK